MLQIYTIFDKYKKIFYFCSMLQRIQTIFILVSVLATVGLFLTSKDVEIPGFLGGVGFLGVVEFICIFMYKIFMYKNRGRQILLNNISIVINALLIGLLVYWLLNLPGGMDFPEKGIEPVFPLISIVFLFMANKNIRRDERLVKSVDRLR